MFKFHVSIWKKKKVINGFSKLVIILLDNAMTYSEKNRDVSIALGFIGSEEKADYMM